LADAFCQHARLSAVGQQIIIVIRSLSSFVVDMPLRKMPTSETFETSLSDQLQLADEASPSYEQSLFVAAFHCAAVGLIRMPLQGVPAVDKQV
jgi:hypothetical protein